MDAEKVDVAVQVLPNTDGIGELAAISQGVRIAVYTA